MNGVRSRLRGRPLISAVAAIACTLLAGCGSSVSGSPTSADPVSARSSATDAALEVIDCPFDKPAVRPAQLILACGDLGAQLEQIAWRGWGPDTAEGDGVERENVCDPNCAAGKHVTRPVHIVLSDIVRPGNVFTKATITDPDGHSQSWPMTRR
ncbi:MAG: hypothetical protein J2P18_05930 [Nocardia sp.]|nr:hypothetical protein [Nocardia sp.]